MNTENTTKTRSHKVLNDQSFAESFITQPKKKHILTLKQLIQTFAMFLARKRSYELFSKHLNQQQGSKGIIFRTEF